MLTYLPIRIEKIRLPGEKWRSLCGPSPIEVCTMWCALLTRINRCRPPYMRSPAETACQRGKKESRQALPFPSRAQASPGMNPFRQPSHKARCTEIHQTVSAPPVPSSTTQNGASWSSSQAISGLGSQYLVAICGLVSLNVPAKQMLAAGSLMPMICHE